MREAVPRPLICSALLCSVLACPGLLSSLHPSTHPPIHHPSIHPLLPTPARVSKYVCMCVVTRLSSSSFYPHNLLHSGRAIATASFRLPSDAVRILIATTSFSRHLIFARGVAHPRVRPHPARRQDPYSCSASFSSPSSPGRARFLQTATCRPLAGSAFTVVLPKFSPISEGTHGLARGLPFVTFTRRGLASPASDLGDGSSARSISGLYPSTASRSRNLASPAAVILLGSASFQHGGITHTLLTYSSAWLLACLVAGPP